MSTNQGGDGNWNFVKNIFRKGGAEALRFHAGGAEALRLVSADGKSKRYNDEIGVARRRTVIETAVLEREGNAHEIAEALVPSFPKIDLFLPDALKDALFVGHLVTDLDSVAGAIGAAALYGGKAALASDINSETAFALERWGIEGDEIPRKVEEVLKEQPSMNICLVDHQQTSQMNPAIDPDNIVGVIDHHALQNKTIVTDRPIYIDIRPWGSMATIIGHTFLIHGRRPPIKVAGVLLCAILSDTLNLQGPTTTEWDRLMVAVLAEIAEVKDIQLLASQQFKAKSKELAGLSAHGLVNGDQKCFSFKTETFQGDIGFGVVETTDDGVIIDRLDELLPEIVACKMEKGMSALFLAVVNIVSLKGTLLLCGPTELSLAKEAFADCAINEELTVMDIGNRVSRKKDYIPAITQAIKKGWTKPTNKEETVLAADLGKLEINPSDPYQRVVRRGSVLMPKVGEHFDVTHDYASKAV